MTPVEKSAVQSRQEALGRVSPSSGRALLAAPASSTTLYRSAASACIRSVTAYRQDRGGQKPEDLVDGLARHRWTSDHESALHCRRFRTPSGCPPAPYRVAAEERNYRPNFCQPHRNAVRRHQRVHQQTIGNLAVKVAVRTMQCEIYREARAVSQPSRCLSLSLSFTGHRTRTLNTTLRVVWCEMHRTFLRETDESR